MTSSAVCVHSITCLDCFLGQIRRELMIMEDIMASTSFKNTEEILLVP